MEDLDLVAIFEAIPEIIAELDTPVQVVGLVAILVFLLMIVGFRGLQQPWRAMMTLVGVVGLCGFVYVMLLQPAGQLSAEAVPPELAVADLRASAEATARLRLQPSLPDQGEAPFPWPGGQPLAETQLIDELVENFADGAPVVAAGDRIEASAFDLLEVEVPAFIFPDSSTRVLTAEDLDGLDETALAIARNEILARNGRQFRSQALAAYFDQFDWYMPTTWSPTLTDIEQENIDLIQEVETARRGNGG